MFINPYKIIFFRNGMPLLANVAGTSQSIPMGDADLVLIETAALHAGLPVPQIADEIAQQPLLTSVFTHLDYAKVTQRLQQYVDVGALLTEAVAEPPVITAKSLSELSSLQTNPLLSSVTTVPDALRLSTHFSVSLTAQGFVAWSAAVNEFVSLTALDVMCLLGFGEGKSLASVLQQKPFLQTQQAKLEEKVALWFAAGLLAPKKEVIAQTELDLQPFQTDTQHALTLDIPKDWQQTSKDQRIPVYFVPHMENHFPLALGVLYSALLAYEDGVLTDTFNFIPLNYMKPDALFNGPYRKFGPGVWLFSNYMWSIDLNLQISQAVVQHNAGNYTIHGGPSTPDYPHACEAFLAENPSIDIAVHGEGEITITEIFATLQRTAKGRIEADLRKLASVTGLTYRERTTGRFLRTADRERMKSPDAVPSPYLSGLFDAYQGRVEAAIIETNRGCPYGCTFCDWGSATNQKIRKFDLERVKDEITWIGENKIRVMWIADANYGLYDRDIEISQFIVDTKKRYGYPQEIVVNYTKNSTWRLVEIIKIFTEGGIIGQGIISIQTTDEKTLEVINRKNIRTQRYDELAQAFTDLNLPLSTDLMIGLPGMTLASFQADLQRYIDMDVSVKAYPTQLLPNSPMAAPDYLEKYEIKADEHGFLTSTYSYTPADLKKMKALYEVYVMADGYGLLRYVMRYLQWEYQVAAGQFMHDLLDDCTAEPDRYPLLTWAVRFFNSDKSMPCGWQAFYAQVSQYLQARYQVAIDTGWQTVFKVNTAAMPDDAVSYPKQIALDHDFVTYFKAASQVLSHSEESVQPLMSLSPASMTFTDPNRLASVDLNSAQYDSHQYFWELHSAVARPKSLAEFAA